jgi:hypothetical protein
MPVSTLAGVALITTSWVRLPNPTTTDPHPALTDSVSIAFPFFAGVAFVLFGLYVLVSFFVSVPLPKTRRERQPPKAAVPSSAATSLLPQPSPGESLEGKVGDQAFVIRNPGVGSRKRFEGAEPD